MSAKIFIDGEAGTTGLQIRDRLADRHDLTLLTIDETQRKDLAARQALLNEADVAILCLPDDAARESVSLIENNTTRVIDASTAHRISEGWEYGFAEMTKGHSTKIANARFIANPGCYPQGLIALIRPLIEAGLLDPAQKLSYHGLSGYTGGGRKFVEAYEDQGAKANPALPYGLTFEHKHLPEMKRYALMENAPLFTPVVGNFAQGMLTTVPLHFDQMNGVSSLAILHDALLNHFSGHDDIIISPLDAQERFSNLSPEMYNNTNKMGLFVFGNEKTGQALLMAIYDNLGKGASGSAVQNLDLLLGIDRAEHVSRPAA